MGQLQHGAGNPPTDPVADHLGRIAEQGYTVIRGVLDADEVAALVEDLGRLEAELGTTPSDNGFEGRATLRVYNLLRHGRMWQRIPTHPSVLPVVEGVLDDGCLVSSLSSVRIMPGETAQPIHADDQLIPLSQPHPPVVCNTMWALTDFTDANGATRLVPGSHRQDKPVFGGAYETVPAEMSAGDVLVWHGSLWHAGGANRTDRDRIGIAMNYCAGWVRQQENQQLGLPPQLVATFEPRLQRLVGYGVYMGLIGHIDKRTPAQVLLDSEGRQGMVWDAAP
jgi:ectoine hydroxylase-related dioxygenase (phytanoyl-CoA dioxygenase family)